MGYAGSQFQDGPGRLNDPLAPFGPPVAPTTYCNEEQTVTLTCPDGTTGDPVTATVDAGELCGYATQELADAAALAQAQTEAEALRELSPCVSGSLIFSTGYGGFGALGLGDLMDQYDFTQIGVADAWANISSGNDSNSSYAVNDSGEMWVWGDNSTAQLGLGDTTDRLSPTQMGVATNWGSTPRDIGCGVEHAIALKSDGTLWAWGRNQWGQLGDGTTTNRPTAIQIGSDTDWVHVSCGGFFTAALKADGTLWTWGHNAYGQMGQGNTSDYIVPTQVGADTDWGFIAAGGVQMYAIKNDGTLWSVGRNNSGQLGLGDLVNRSTLTQVGVSAAWSSINSGREHAVALQADGTLWTWGYNVFGQLGNGTTSDTDTPGQIGALTTWVEVAGGNFFSMARRSDETLWAWGDNGLGELGTGIGSPSTDVPVLVGSETNWTRISLGKQHSLGMHGP